MQEISRKKPILKNRVAPEIEEAVVAIAIENPALGQVRVSNELRQQGIAVSPGGVRSIWLRHNWETFKKRLKALEEKAAKEDLIFTEAQLQALERAQAEKEAHGEIETHHSGYIGLTIHLVCGQYQRRWTHLPADFYRYLHAGWICETIYSTQWPDGGRPAQ